MKKFLLSLALLATMVPAIQAQDNLYLMVRDSYYGQTWTPGNSDPYLELTGDGIYEGQVELKKGQAFMFYLGDADKFTVYGSNSESVSMLQFTNYAVYNATLQENSYSTWMISKLNPQDLTVAPVNITVNLNTLSAQFEQANVAEEVFDNVYVWGSTDGGLSYKMVQGMTQSSQNENLFSATIAVPKVDGAGYDPEMGAVDGYLVMLGASNTDLWNNTRFTAPLEDKEIDITSDETFEVTLIKNTGSGLLFVTPGDYTITFNVDSYEFTAAYADGSSTPENPGDDEPGNTPGGDDQPGNTPGGDDEPGNTPGGDDQPEGPTTGVESLEINGSVNVYDLNGKPVYNGNAKGLGNLQKGIYIVNGKKVVIK